MASEDDGPITLKQLRKELKPINDRLDDLEAKADGVDEKLSDLLVIFASWCTVPTPASSQTLLEMGRPDEKDSHAL